MKECELQSSYDDLLGGRIWEAFLLEKIEEMEKAYGVSIPWKGELRRVVPLKLERRLVLERIGRNMITNHQLAVDLGLSESAIRKVTVLLEKEGLIIVNRSVRPHKYRLANVSKN